MKRLGLTLALPPAILFVFTALRAADPTAAGAAPAAAPELQAPAAAPSAETARPERKRLRQEAIKRFDEDADGRLNEHERSKAREAVREKQKARPGRAATAGRGERKIDPAAPVAGHNGMTRQEMLTRFDRNADGKLDDIERAEMREQVRDRVQNEKKVEGTKSGGGVRQEMVRRFDANNDGTIDDAEWTKLEPALRKRIEAAPSMAKRYDQDSDGKLDDTEWVTATSKVKRWLNQQPPADGNAAKRKAPAKQE